MNVSIQVNPSAGPTSSREQNANLSNEPRCNRHGVYLNKHALRALSKHIFPNKRYSGCGLGQCFVKPALAKLPIAARMRISAVLA